MKIQNLIQFAFVSFVVTIILMLFGSAQLSSAQQPSTYNIVSDFSLLSNPNGVYSYGYTTSLGASPILYAGLSSNTPQGLDILGISNPVSLSTLPFIAKNTTGNLLSYLNIRHPADMLNIHPGPNGEYSVLRFTAPTTGSYQIDGLFQGIDQLGTTTDVHVIRQGTEVFSGQINGFNSTSPFSLTLSMTVGQNIDFVVGFGSNGNNFRDSTGVRATITLTSIPQCVQPEPGWDFETIPIGTTKERVFNFTNNTSISFTPQNFTLEEATDYCIKDNTCENILLNPGQSCSWTASFTARAGGIRRSREYNILTAQGLTGSQCNGLTGRGTINPNHVIPQFQVSYPSIPYGYCTNAATGYTIKSRGCALTSLSMAINYVLKSAPAPATLETPATLNAFASSIGGFSWRPAASFCVKGPSNDVLFERVTNNYPLITPATQRALKWRDVTIANNPTALSNVLKEGYPVIVGIVHKKDTAQCNSQQPSANCFYNAHYVLAIGENLSVIDPEVTSGAVSLQSVISRRAVKRAIGWQARGQVRVRDGAFDLPRQARNCPVGNFCNENDFTTKNNLFTPLESKNFAETDFTSLLTPNNATNTITQISSVNSADDGSLSVFSDEKVDFLVIDSQGRRTGYNNTNGQIVEEIPNSTYYLENIIAFDEPVDNTVNSIAEISRPATGRYQVTVKGTQAGQYRVTINRSNRYGQPLTPIIFNGSIQVGETITHTFNYTSSKNPVDYDDDGNADISVFRPSNSVWYMLNSQSGFSTTQFGISTDKITPADFDGDGKTDVAVYRGGTWYLLRSTAGFTGIAFGDGNDVPQPADFDGDGKADLAVYRPSNGFWYVLNLQNNQFTAAQFGNSTDKPVAADYDGDGKANYALFRSADNSWHIARPTGDPIYNFYSVQFGTNGDILVPADYDGDGKTDQAVYRNGAWYILGSTRGFHSVQFGIAGDVPVAGDYDADGKTDQAVYRNGIWYMLRSQQGFGSIQFGTTNDKPIPAAYIP